MDRRHRTMANLPPYRGLISHAQNAEFIQRLKTPCPSRPQRTSPAEMTFRIALCTGFLFSDRDDHVGGRCKG
jgi:hypothetical protein